MKEITTIIIWLIIMALAVAFTLLDTHAKINHSSFIGTSLSYTDLTNAKPVNEYEQVKSPELLSVNFGQAFSTNNYVVKIGTNRLYNKSQKRQLKVDNKQILNKSKATTDYVVVEKLIKNYGVGFFVSNAKLEQESYYKNFLVEKTKKHAIIYGLSISSYLSRNISLSLNYMFENKEFGFSAYVLGINYNF